MGVMTGTISDQTCTGCGACAAVCPSELIAWEPRTKARFTPEHASLCIACGQCMAACPEEALTVGDLDYHRDFAPWPGQQADEAGMMGLMATRRSIRQFKDKPVDRETCQRLLDMMATAPMGFPPHTVEVTLVRGREVMDQVAALLHQQYRDLLPKLDNPIVKFIIRRAAGAADYNSVMLNLKPLLPLMVQVFEQTPRRNKYTYDAPAMLLLHAPKDMAEHTVDGHILASWATLAIHSLGLGSCWLGVVEPMVNRSPQLRSLVGLPEGHEVVASLVFGHPRNRYRRVMRRRFPAVHWVGDRD